MGIRIALGVMGVVCLLGCSSSDAAKSTSAPARMADPAVRAQLKPVLDAQCGWLFNCCSEGELAVQLGPATSSDCADHLLQSATTSYPYGLVASSSAQNLLAALNYLQYGFDHSAVTISEAAITACAAQLSAQKCNPAPPADHCVPAEPLSDDACAVDKLLVGSLPAGADCTAFGANECGAGLWCRAVANEAGVCIPKPVEGDLCLRDDDCGSLICDWASGTCVAGAAYGEACAFNDPAHPLPGTESTRCQPGLACDTVTLECTDARCAAGSSCSADAECPKGVRCVANSCGPLRKVGEQCNQAKDCAAGDCIYDPLAGRQLCTAPKAAGESCNQSSDCASGFCLYDQLAMASSCVPAVKNGQPCMQAEQCTSGKCGGDGTCAAVAVGDACTADSDCAPSQQLFCTEKGCARAPFADGVSCRQNAQCKSEVCLAGQCSAKSGPGDACGTSDDAPCDEDSYCAIAPGKAAGRCAAKKAAGELCSLDLECASACQTVRGERRCAGEPRGIAQCGGT